MIEIHFVSFIAWLVVAFIVGFGASMWVGSVFYDGIVKKALEHGKQIGRKEVLNQLYGRFTPNHDPERPE